MTKFKYIAFLLANLLLLTNCAKRGTITGGDKDTIAPKIINSNPDNFTTNFKGNEIKINFNVPKVVKSTNKVTFHKTLKTSVINSPVSIFYFMTI